MRRLKARDSGVVTVGMVTVIGTAAFLVTPRETTTPWPHTKVRSGAFVDEIVETGTVTAARLMLYGAPVGGGQFKIVSIVPEGSSVEPGAELIRFDDSVVTQSIEKEKAALRQAEAELLGAREDLRIEQLRAQGEIETATQAVSFAERELANQMEGKGRLATIEAEAAASEAARELEQARSTFDDIKALLPEGFVTRAEVDRAEQGYRRAQEQLRLAQFKVDTLANYERPAAIDRSMADVNSTRGELNRSSETAGSRLAQRRAALSAAQARVEETRARVSLLNEQLARTVVRADGAGLVVYRELFFGADKRKPQVGDEVWPNQPLIALPDSTQLMIETRVREIDLHKVETSQRVQVRFDAYPDIRLPASVAIVGALAQEDAARAGTKYFPVTVKLVEVDPRLRTGMTAQVSIEVAAADEATLVPIEAVFGSAPGMYAVVLKANAPVRRPVSIGASNGTTALIKSGLGIGEDVLLVDPTR
ncbi:MAG: HlyD family efflux transporter periplasmic adaptor subunit [Acidobacteria bacterium]|nr:MAG: HlyD family efflux transporter periplasmic adaptor subunit [Acidobacteriota bacterium]